MMLVFCVKEFESMYLLILMVVIGDEVVDDCVDNEEIIDGIFFLVFCSWYS